MKYRVSLQSVLAGLVLTMSIVFLPSRPSEAQEIRSFDPRGLVIGVGFGTGTYSGDLGPAFKEANSSVRFESFYNFSERLSLGLNFISSKYGLRGDSRGSLGLSARFRFLEDRLSPYVTGGFHVLNGGDKTGSGPTAGLGVELATSDRFGLYLEGLWQASTPDDAFEGVAEGSGLDNLITVGIGARVRLTQPNRPRFAVTVIAPDTVLVGDVVNLVASIAGDPSSPVYLLWRVEQFTEYRGDDIRHAFTYLGSQSVVLIGRNKRYEVRVTKDIVVVDDPIFERNDDLLPGTPTAVVGLVRVLEIYGDRQVKVDEAHNYRLRIKPGAVWPVNYQWEMGDGTALIGNNVLHRYRSPGSYTVTAVARNPMNADTLTTEVLVSSAEMAAAPSSGRPDRAVAAADTPRQRVSRYHPDELRNTGGIVVSAGGYGWLVGNYLDRQPAEQRMRQFKVRGFRAGIVTDRQGGGSQVFRVVVGQFASSSNAMAAKREVQRLNDNPVSLLEIGAPVPATSPVPITRARPRQTPPVPDQSPPVISRPIVRHVGPENATSLDISQLSASDPESNIAKIEYRIISPGGSDVWTDWTTIVEPGAPSAETSTVAELPMFARDQDIVLEARATNGIGLTSVSSVNVTVDVDESPPGFGSTDVTVSRVDSDFVVDLDLRGIDDQQSGIAQARYRIVDSRDGSIVYADWIDVTGRPRVIHSVSRLNIQTPRTVRVELEAQNGAGTVSSFAKTVDIPAIVAVTGAREPVSSVAPPAAVVPPAEDTSPAATSSPQPGPQVKSLKVYIRENRLLVFLDGVADVASNIDRVDYRVLDSSGNVLTDWSPISLVPPGKQEYGLQMHRLPVPSGATGDSRVEVRVTNAVGGRTVIGENVSAGS